MGNSCFFGVRFLTLFNIIGGREGAGNGGQVIRGSGDGCMGMMAVYGSLRWG